MIRIRDQIANGSKLETIDSTSIGDKYTHCSWDLCSCNEEQYPDKEDWSRPDQRNFPIMVKHHLACPMDKKPSEFGCFYRCRIFQDGLKDREQVVQLYTIAIKGEQALKATTNGNAS